MRQLREGAGVAVAQPEETQAIRQQASDAPSVLRQQVITITSGKGGVGKSNVTINLAIGLAKAGKRVLVVDTDVGFSNIGTLIGVSTRRDITAILDGSYTMRDIMYDGPCGIRFISGGTGLLELQQYSDAILWHIVDSLRRLSDDVDIVMFDTGAGVSRGVIDIVKSSDDVLLVTMPEPTALIDAYSVIKHVSAAGTVPTLHLCVNRVDDEREALVTAQKLSAVVGEYLHRELRYLGHIVDDDHMIKAVKTQSPILLSYPNAAASRNIRTICDKLLGNHNEKRHGLSSFWHKLRGRQG